VQPVNGHCADDRHQHHHGPGAIHGHRVQAPTPLAVWTWAATAALTLRQHLVQSGPADWHLHRQRHRRWLQPRQLCLPAGSGWFRGRHPRNPVGFRHDHRANGYTVKFAQVAANHLAWTPRVTSSCLDTEQRLGNREHDRHHRIGYGRRAGNHAGRFGSESSAVSKGDEFLYVGRDLSAMSSACRCRR